MYGKKYFDTSNGTTDSSSFRRAPDYSHHLPGGLTNTRYHYTNYGSLLPASQQQQQQHTDENEQSINSINWTPLECTFANLHHHMQFDSLTSDHSGGGGGNGGDGDGGGGSNGAGSGGNFATIVDNNDISGGGGNVNELSTTSAEHVINLYDLRGNRVNSYADNNFNDQQSSNNNRQGTDSFGYNSSDENGGYCHTAALDEQSSSVGWLDSDSVLHESLMSIPNHATTASQSLGPMMLSISAQSNNVESNNHHHYQLRENVPTMSCYELDKLNIHKPTSISTNYGQYQSSSGMFACSSKTPYLPLKDYKNFGSNGMSVNLAMNMSMTSPHSLVESKTAVSGMIHHPIQCTHHHTSKYQLMAKLSERITIKEQHNVDLYRLDLENENNYCKAKALYSQMKQICIDRVDHHETSHHHHTHSHSLPPSHPLTHSSNSALTLHSSLSSSHTALRPSSATNALHSNPNTHVVTHHHSASLGHQSSSSAISAAAAVSATNTNSQSAYVNHQHANVPFTTNSSPPLSSTVYERLNGNSKYTLHMQAPGPSSAAVYTQITNEFSTTKPSPPPPAVSMTNFRTSMLEVKSNVCLICGKTYARPSTLKTHLRTHSGEKPYRCHICTKAFSQAANLTAHIRTHSGEKPFPCPICNRRFSQSSSVTTHLRTHSGERPYCCDFCSKSFSDSSTLTKHLRIHSGEKPYQCRICTVRFSQSGNLNRHMRVHNIRL